MSKPILTREIAQETWECMDKPSSRRCKDRLEAAGYICPSHNTINKWAKQGQWKNSGLQNKTIARLTRPRPIRKAQRLDDASPALTGDPRSNAQDVVDAAMNALPPKDEPPKLGEPEDALEASLKRLRDVITGGNAESLLEEVSRRTYVAAAVIQTIIAEGGPALIASNPEGIARLHLAAAESLPSAAIPLDRIGIMREQAMKTINAGGAGEVIENGANADPLADSISAFKKRHAA